MLLATTRSAVGTSCHLKYSKLLISYRYSSGASSENNTVYEDICSKTNNLVLPEYFNFAKNIVGKWTKDERTALWLTDGKEHEKVTYFSIYTQAQRLATALSTLGDNGPPHCAMVILPKIKEWWVINVAGSWCNTIISPASHMLTAKDVKQRLEKYPSVFDCIICNAEIAERIDDVTKHINNRIVVDDPINARKGWINYTELVNSVNQNNIMQCVSTKGTDICQMFFTSGTTGTPKIVPHTQAAFGIGHIITSKYFFDLTEKDVIWCMSDPGWVLAAYGSLYCPWIAGATTFVHKMLHFDPLEVARTLRENPVTVLAAPPTVYRSLVNLNKNQLTFSSLRFCFSGGEPISPEVMESWEKLTGLTIHNDYGQTEFSPICVNFKGMEIRPGSMGKQAPGVILKILNDNMEELGNKEVGNLAVDLRQGRPIGLFEGYLHSNPTKHKMVKPFQGNYYFTGDKAYRDEDGYFWFVGRADDVIISAGYRIGPIDIESSLLEHPAVVEAAVVSSPVGGEVVKAFIVLSEEYTNNDKDALITELQTHVKAITAPYKYPRKVEFVTSLPKTIYGKIRRVELRKQEWKIPKYHDTYLDNIEHHS